MPRKSTEEKGETHDRLVARASREFRGKGTGVPIADLMKMIGMTHGGFYRHFASKDDLLVESVASALHEMADHLDELARKAEKGGELAAIIDAYLSVDHLRHPETWCALAALGPDIARQPAAVRARLAEALQYYQERISPYMPGRNREEQRRTFLILISAMSGVIAMIRVFPDKSMQEQTLAMARQYYLTTFAQ